MEALENLMRSRLLLYNFTPMFFLEVLHSKVERIDSKKCFKNSPHLKIREFYRCYNQINLVDIYKLKNLGPKR